MAPARQFLGGGAIRDPRSMAITFLKVPLRLAPASTHPARPYQSPDRFSPTNRQTPPNTLPLIDPPPENSHGINHFDICDLWLLSRPPGVCMMVPGRADGPRCNRFVGRGRKVSILRRPWKVFDNLGRGAYREFLASLRYFALLCVSACRRWPFEGNSGVVAPGAVAARKAARFRQLSTCPFGTDRPRRSDRQLRGVVTGLVGISNVRVGLLLERPFVRSSRSDIAGFQFGRLAALSSNGCGATSSLGEPGDLFPGND